MSDKKQTILPGVDDDEIIKRLKEDENTVPYMYLDSLNNVTVGTGRMLPSSRETKNLQFYKLTGEEGHLIDRNILVPGFEVERAFNKVREKRSGSKRGRIAFDPLKNSDVDQIGLASEDINDMLRDDLQRSAKELRHKFRDQDFDSFPLSAQKALIDMQFNMGDRKFQDVVYESRTKTRPGWPNLLNAVRRRDWATAARESHLHQVQQDRNDYVYKLLMDSQGEDGQ